MKLTSREIASINGLPEDVTFYLTRGGVYPGVKAVSKRMWILASTLPKRYRDYMLQEESLSICSTLVATLEEVKTIYDNRVNARPNEPREIEFAL